jgi:hypothetical protein
MVVGLLPMQSLPKSGVKHHKPKPENRKIFLGFLKFKVKHIPIFVINFKIPIFLKKSCLGG